MTNKRLETILELASESHARIQADFADINPLVGVNQQMRTMGVPADVMTIDHLGSNKRIILILHDHYPDIVHVHFSFKDTDPDDSEPYPFNELTADTLYKWIKDYFQS